MTLEQGLFAKLTGTSAIAALVAAKVYPTIAPSGTEEPFIVYDIASDTEFSYHSGPSGLHSALVNVRGIAKTQPEAVALGRAIQTALHGAEGSWGTLSVARAVAGEPQVGYIEETGSFDGAVPVQVQYSE